MPLFRVPAGSSRPGCGWPSTAARKLACQRGSRSAAASPACRSWAAASAGSALSSGASPLAPPAAARRTASFTTHCLQQPWQRCLGWSDLQTSAAQPVAGQPRRGPCPAPLRLHPPRPDVDFCDCVEAVLRHCKRVRRIMQRCQRQRRHTSATSCSRHRSPQAGQSWGRHDRSICGPARCLSPASPPPALHLVKQAAHGLVDESGGGQRPAHARQAAAMLLGVRLRGRRARASGRFLTGRLARRVVRVQGRGRGAAATHTSQLLHPAPAAQPPTRSQPLTSRRAPRPLPRASSRVRAPKTNSTSSAWWQPISASAPPPPSATNTRTPGRSVNPAMDRSSGSLPPTAGGGRGSTSAPARAMNGSGCGPQHAL